MPRILEDVEGMYYLLSQKHGLYKGGLALAHCQITNRDPLRFFVTNGGEVIINPVITNHTRHTSKKKEACLSYPNKETIQKDRYNKIEIEYQDLEHDESGFKISDIKEKSLSGVEAQVYQHEIDHFNAVYCFDET